MIRLLDTNVVSSLARDPQGPAGQALRRLPPDEVSQVATSIVVAAELRFGIAKAPRAAAPIISERVEAILSRLPVHALDAPSDRRYAEIRAHLERRGEIIGGNDLLIAAQSLALGAILVTDNVTEFGRVLGLQVENWLR